MIGAFLENQEERFMPNDASCTALSARKQAILDRDFKLIEEAATKGERCPQTQPHGPLQHASSGSLARAGRIRIEIFAHNWRVATIMQGPHKGKQTLRSPYKGTQKPYRVIYKDHVAMNTRGGRPRNVKITLAPIRFSDASGQ